MSDTASPPATDRELILVIDDALRSGWPIARNVRDLGVYCELRLRWDDALPDGDGPAGGAGEVKGLITTAGKPGDVPAAARRSTVPLLVVHDDGAEAWLPGRSDRPAAAYPAGDEAALRDFLFRICGCRGTWTTEAFIEDALANIRAQVGDGRAVCGLSGGVDSTVAALLVHRAIGDRLTCLFVDHGLLRAREAQEVMDSVAGHGLNVVYVDAQERFLSKLAGVADPEEKRKIIGNEFIAVFEEHAQKLGPVDFLVQGTVYSDVVESGAGSGALVKSHHNVGGLPERMRLRLVEPLRELFKDEVRRVGAALGLPESIVHRHPFPGPGLAIRVLGEVTPERVAVVRAADAIVVEEIRRAGLYHEIFQCFAILTDARSVGVRDERRVYGYTVAVRAVASRDGMTSEWVRLPYDVLDRIASRIVNDVPQVNRVVYDVTTKPPATIEWE